MCKENLKIVENARCQIDSEWRQQNEKYDIKRNWYIGTDMGFGVGHVRMPREYFFRVRKESVCDIRFFMIHIVTKI